MGERMTSISVKGGICFSDWGRKSPEEMIKAYREIARQRKEEAEAILNANDEDFRIETHTGVHVRRNLEVLQGGSDV